MNCARVWSMAARAVVGTCVMALVVVARRVRAEEGCVAAANVAEVVRDAPPPACGDSEAGTEEEALAEADAGVRRARAAGAFDVVGNDVASDERRVWCGGA